MDTQITDINERKEFTEVSMNLKMQEAIMNNFMLNFENLDEVVNLMLFSLWEDF